MRWLMTVVLFLGSAGTAGCSGSDDAGPALGFGAGAPASLPGLDAGAGAGGDSGGGGGGGQEEDGGFWTPGGGGGGAPVDAGGVGGGLLVDAAATDIGPAFDALVDAFQEPECLEPACTLCRPCMTDAECSLGAGACVEAGPEGRFCRTPCGDGVECPDGFVCEDVDGELLCGPADGQACPCLDAFLGLPTLCWAEVDGARCEALRTCDAPCPIEGPVQEECNGLDDDCDGDTDEDLGTAPCGVGPCAHDVTACVDGKLGPCDAFAGAMLETCNGLDDDCDGAPDDGMGDVPCGQGACAHPVPACVDGQPAECAPLTGAADEICNAIDDDCDGEVDEGLDEVICGVGACAHALPPCANGNPVACDPLEGSVEETCNGLDDDCNGEVDDGLGAIACGVGACAHESPACVDAADGACDPLEGATPEACNGVDDDCDGQADEDLPEVDCGVGACAHLVAGCTNGAVACDPLLNAAPETCNGVDDDCDGETDEGLGETTCGSGPCKVTVTNCVGGSPQPCVPTPPPAGTCSAAPAACKTTTTGLDACGNDCSKVGPAQCYTVHPACLTSSPGAPTDATTCTTPKGKYNCGLTGYAGVCNAQDWQNSIGADCAHCWNIFCSAANGQDNAQFKCNNLPTPPTP